MLSENILINRERKLIQLAALLVVALALSCGITNAATAKTITVTPENYHGEHLVLAFGDQLQLQLTEKIAEEIWWISHHPSSLEIVTYEYTRPQTRGCRAKQIVFQRNPRGETGPQRLILIKSHPIWAHIAGYFQVNFEFRDLATSAPNTAEQPRPLDPTERR